MKAARLGVLVLIASLAASSSARSSGVHRPVAQFRYFQRPPLDAFSRGQIGIIRGSYRPRYLVVAYRYLTAVPLSRSEASAFASPTVESPNLSSGAGYWLAMRNQFTGISPIPYLHVHRQRQDPNTFVWYLNCLDDAFGRAADTLKERGVAWGNPSERLTEWIRGQDTVFANCHSGSSIPARLAESVDPLLGADRRYQIAAAEFYSEQYTEAETDFRAIAADTKSPWHSFGLYMVARTMIRAATVSGDRSGFDKAERTLREVLRDPALSERHESARRLLSLVAIRRDPQRQLTKLADQLMQRGSAASFTEAMSELGYLRGALYVQPNPKQNDMLDWIVAFESNDWEQAVEVWQLKRSDPWLIAALASVPTDHASVPELIAAARRIKPGSAAWPSATFYGALLQANHGEPVAARAWIEDALKMKLTSDTRNALLGVRLGAAGDWQDFLGAGPRVPVAMTMENEDEAIEASLLPRTSITRSTVIDRDFTTLLNQAIPLTRWMDAASSSRLPPSIQGDIAQAGWVRAVILDQLAEARLLGERLALLRPSLTGPLRAWLREPDTQAAKFAAVFLMLRTPGLQPVVRDGFGRATSDERIDSIRDNWWSLKTPAGSDSVTGMFLPAAELTQGQSEFERLRVVAPFGPDYLSALALAWVRSHLGDPRNPETLHLIVRAGRYPPAGPRDPRYAKEAFQLLHARYPKTEWAQRTPFWY